MIAVIKFIGSGRLYTIKNTTTIAGTPGLLPEKVKYPKELNKFLKDMKNSFIKINLPIT